VPLRLILFWGLVFLFSGCALKEVSIEDPYQVLLEVGLAQRGVKGRLYLEGESLFLKDNFSGGAYGTFLASENFLYITLKPPLASEIHLFWQKGEDFVKLIHPDKQKVYFYKLPRLAGLPLPEYFLGLKEEHLSFKEGLLQGEYTFERPERLGKLSTNLLRMSWKIKEIEFTEEKPILPDLKDFKKKVFEFPD